MVLTEEQLISGLTLKYCEINENLKPVSINNMCKNKRKLIFNMDPKEIAEISEDDACITNVYTKIEQQVYGT